MEIQKRGEVGMGRGRDIHDIEERLVPSPRQVIDAHLFDPGGFGAARGVPADDDAGVAVALMAEVGADFPGDGGAGSGGGGKGISSPSSSSLPFSPLASFGSCGRWWVGVLRARGKGEGRRRGTGRGRGRERRALL